MMNNRKIGLALGAGASRGLAHIGVLKALEDANIEIDYIAGSSIGAIVGALYACGVKPHIMEGIAKNIDVKAYYDFRIPRKGFIEGKRVEELINLLTGNRDFSDLSIPLVVTATDLVRCERVLLKEGKVSRAVRASISIPGIFHPVEDGERLLVDGGVLERVPVGVVRNMGADIVIGVDVGFYGHHKKAKNIYEVIFQSLEVMELEIIRNTVSDDDILIIPAVQHINPMSYEQVDECVDAGVKAANGVMDRLKELIYK